jgi:chemotaxis protein MotB
VRVPRTDAAGMADATIEALFLYAVVRVCYDGTPQYRLVFINVGSFRGRSVFFPAQLGDCTMMTLGLKRSVLPLLCVASVLLSGCVSKGKYNDLDAKYNDLQGQYATLQGQHQKLQQSSAAQAAQSSAEMAAMKKELAADKVHVTRLQDAIKYTVNSDLLFRSGSWEMSKQGQEVIAKLAPRLAPFQQSKIVVNGYTDNAPVGRALQQQGVTSNEVLSQKRAEAVMQYLISQGVKPDFISARGFGEAEPIAPNKTAEGRAQNRRVELTLTGQTSP